MVERPGIRYKAVMHRAPGIALAAFVGSALAWGGCSKGGARAPDGGAGGSGGGDGPASIKSQLLSAFGACAAARTTEFRDRAVALDEAVTAWAATPDDETAGRDAARAAFRDAMRVWQRLEMMQFGPTGSSSTVPGGRNFRDNIYPWPAFGRCAVDEALVGETYTAANFGTAFLSNRRGLTTAEYLLFYEGTDTGCAAGSATHTAWPTLTGDELARRKRAYASVALADLRARAIALADAWGPQSGNFVETLRSAGPGNTVFRTTQQAIQSVGIALFYLDAMVKDDKVGDPLDAGCSTASCFESRYGALSKENIRANLGALRDIVEGCEPDHAGAGFDDLLVAIGATDAAASLTAAAAAAESALEAIEEPDLPEAAAGDRASVVALREAIAGVTTLLKTDFVTLLDFEPAVIPTDND